VKMFIFAFLAFMHPAFCQSSDCNTLEECQAAIKANLRSSLPHYRLGEIFFNMENPVACNSEHPLPCKYYQSAVNEFRKALNGDHDPKWIDVWSHIDVGKIFDLTGQHERALVQYRLARQTKDNTRSAQDEAAKYTASPFKLAPN
jgi:tetratricopeptide (TPR) repeat protein